MNVIWNLVKIFSLEQKTNQILPATIEKVRFCLFKKTALYSFTVCSYHITYTFQSESTLYSYLNVKELLAWSRCKIWSLGDCNWTWTQNHLVHKQTLNHLAKLAKWLSCAEYLSVWCIWLYVLAMSCRCFRVNPHFIVQLQSLKL